MHESLSIPTGKVKPRIGAREVGLGWYSPQLVSHIYSVRAA
jgi:hypothetical protein